MYKKLTSNVKVLFKEVSVIIAKNWKWGGDKMSYINKLVHPYHGILLNSIKE